MKIQLGTEMQKHCTEAYGSPIHEHEFARHLHRTALLERLVHLECFAAAVFGRLDPVREATHPVFQQRPVDEARPDVERSNHFVREIAKTPGLVGVHNEIIVALEKPPVEIDHTANELGGEDADAAVVEQIDAPRPAIDREDRVIAEMRVAVDDAEATER